MRNLLLLPLLLALVQAQTAYQLDSTLTSLIAQAQYDSAAKVAERAMDSGISYHNLHLAAGKAYLYAGKTPQSIRHLLRATRLNRWSDAWGTLVTAYSLNGDAAGKRYAAIRSGKSQYRAEFSKFLDAQASVIGVKYPDFSERSPLWMSIIGFDCHVRNFSFTNRYQQYNQTFFPPNNSPHIAIQQQQYYLRTDYRFAPAWSASVSLHGTYTLFDTVNMWGYLWYGEMTHYSPRTFAGAYVSQSYLNNKMQRQAGLRAGVKPFGSSPIQILGQAAISQPRVGDTTHHLFADLGVIVPMGKKFTGSLNGTLGKLENTNDRQGEDLYNALDITQQKLSAWVSFAATPHMMLILVGSYEQKEDFFYRKLYNQYGLLFTFLWKP